MSLHSFFKLIKFRIPLLVSASTACGYLMFSSSLEIELLYVVMGILLLASGSAALNQWQERNEDARMDRTKKRPLPSGQLSSKSVLFIISLLLFSGSLVLYFLSGIASLVLGLLTILIYNALYTPLKKRTAFAVLPGSFVGAIPPLIGWVTAGGNLFDVQAMLVAFFIFIWQVPHFFFLLLMHPDDYKKAGFHVLSDNIKALSIRRISFVWILACAAIVSLFPVFGILGKPVMIIIAYSTSAIFALISLPLIWEKAFDAKAFFLRINIFLLLILSQIIIDSLT